MDNTTDLLRIASVARAQPDLFVEDSVLTREGGAAYLRTGVDGVHLTAADVRRLIDRLEPLAAPPRSLIDDFNDLPVGTVFRFTDSMTSHVKVSNTHFTVLRGADGKPGTYPIVDHADATTYGIEGVDL